MGIARLSSIFISVNSTKVAVIAPETPVIKFSDLIRYTIINEDNKKARLPSRVLLYLYILIFPNLFPNNAAAESDNVKNNKQATAMLLS